MAKKNGKAKEAPRRRRRRWPWFLLRWGLVSASWGTLVGLMFLGWLAYDLPDVSRLNEIRKQPSVTLLADDGEVIATYGDLYGATVQLKDLPRFLPQAVLATEDRRFYGHFGLDPIGLARAAYINLRDWRLTQGGSTITQQLAKNVFLTPARTVRRKGQEMLLALWLERNFSKDQILTLYLNRVYFGAGTYGVDAASRKFFGKPASQVTPFEAAMLAGLLRAPSVFNPMNDREAAEGRAQLVLQNMVAADFLSAKDADAIAKNKQVSTSYAASGHSGQHFADWVMDQVSGYVGFVDRDLVVVTTLDPRLQKIAETELAKMLDAEGPKRNAGQAALVTLSPDGAVRAMVGGRDYAGSQFNRATQSLRQPGSAFKAFVFLAGFEHGLTPDDRMFDGPISVGGWKPGNYENNYQGDVTLREAFAKSLNSVAVQVSERVGRKNVRRGGASARHHLRSHDRTEHRARQQRGVAAGADRRLRHLRQRRPGRVAARHRADPRSRRRRALSARGRRPRPAGGAAAGLRHGRPDDQRGRYAAPEGAPTSGGRLPARPAPARTSATPGSSASRPSW